MKCDRGSRVSCKGRHTWVGVSRRPGSSDALHHEGKPSASLFGLMESEVLDWKAAGTGSVHCRREPTVSPNTWPAGGKRTYCRGGKTDASPNCQTEEKWGWTLSAHQTSRGGCDRSEWGERVWGGQIRYCGLASRRWCSSPHPDSVRNDSEEPKRQVCWAASGQLVCVVAGEGKAVPRAPQTIVGGGCAAWAPLLPEGSFLGSNCSLDKEEEGVEWSLILLGINCLRAADCVLAERNFSTTELTASPNNPDCEMGASSTNTFSFSWISVRLSHKWRSAATEPAIERTTGVRCA